MATYEREPETMMRIFASALCVAGIIFCQGCMLWSGGQTSPATVVFMSASQQVAPDSSTQTGLKSPRTVYVQLKIRSEPTAATVKINNILVGTTPLIASVPFVEGPYGKPTGTAELSLQKPGYLPKVVPLYPVGERSICLEPEGKPLDRYIFHLDQP